MKRKAAILGTVGALVVACAAIERPATAQTFICTPASPGPSPAPSAAPSAAPTALPLGEPYTFQTQIDLVPPEPRLWFALQTAGSVFNNWTTYGLANSIVPAYEGNPSTEFLPYCNFAATGCSASTAATDLQNFQEGLDPAYKVLWRLTWYPRSSSADVRLVLMDSGWANPIILATTEGETKLDRAYTTGGYITDTWNTVAAGRQAKYLGMAIRGNGSIGPVVYQSRVTIVHRIQR